MTSRRRLHAAHTPGHEPGLPTNLQFYRLVHRVSNRLSTAVAAVFSEAVLKLQGQVNESILRSALASQNLAAVDAAVGTQVFENILRNDPRLERTILRAITATGQAGADILEDTTGLNAVFNAASPRVILAARELTAELVVQVSDDVKAAIRAVTAAGAEIGLTPVQQARLIRTVVGIRPDHVPAVLNLVRDLEAAASAPAGSPARTQAAASVSRRRLDAVTKGKLRKHIREGTLSSDVIGGARETYSRSLLNYRAQSIARTETLRAAHIGQHEGWKQAIEQEVLPDNTRRFWIVTPDERLKHEEVPGMNPDGRGMEEEFDTPEGAFLHPPSRTNCRCSVGLLFIGRGAG